MVLLMLPPQAGGGSATIDRSTYLAELNRTTAIVGSDSPLEQVLASASDLPDRWPVEIDGETVIVDASWIRAEIRAATTPSWPSVRQRIISRLTTMTAEATEPTFEHGRDPDAVLAETLARREFQRSASSIWLEEQRERFSRWILGLVNRLFGPSLGARAVAMIVAWSAAVLALGALSFWFVSMLTRRSRATVLEHLSVVPTETSAREWALRAAAAAGSGDLREAVRCGYHAALCKLEEQGIWRIDRSLTPREHVRLLAREDPRFGALSDLTRQFEQVCYGQRPVTDDEARQLIVHLEGLACLRPADRAI